MGLETAGVAVCQWYMEAACGKIGAALVALDSRNQRDPLLTNTHDIGSDIREIRTYGVMWNQVGGRDMKWHCCAWKEGPETPLDRCT